MTKQEKKKTKKKKQQATLPAPARADAQKNRQRILQAARALVARGDGAPGLNEVARRARVGVATVYRHFATPQALLEALAAARFAELDALLDVARADDDVARGLRGLLWRTLQLELGDPGFAAVVFAADVWQAPTAAAFAVLDEKGAALLARARAAGVVRDDVTPNDLRRLVCGVAHACKAGGARGADDATRYLDVLLRGLAPTVQPRARTTSPSAT